ncbi:sigma-70 family RNA polymerase sigma factor [Actinoplanes sp. NPDC051343]|uniref:sigma-70 family RNA polymerase sigma factor n=1 Tax=Actinoplanes sp. NPDC051343 TaxID=3363906 RepID=UPI003790EED0
MLFTKDRVRSAAEAAEQRINRVHAEHSGAVLHFLMSLTGERHTAEDLLQETMIRAWQHLDTIPDDYETTRRWLFVVARRVTIDAIRMRQARPTETALLDLIFVLATPDTTETVIARESLKRAASRLSEAHRVILADLYLQGRSVQETARRHGLPVGTVKSRAHYALRMLRQNLSLAS